jgi:hypothetical protein
MMKPSMAGARAYTDEEVDAAVQALSEPGRLRDAQDLVARAAPQLQRVLNEALDEGGWFSGPHDSGVRSAVGIEDAGERERAVRTLVAEETRLGMLVGVAVGYELARQLPTSED